MTDAAAVAREALGDRPAPELAVVLGSGLGAFADAVEDAVAVSYADLPGFPVSTVAGHAGRLVLGTLANTPVAVFQGRSHLYEGVAPQKLALGVRTAKALGAHSVLLTNAAGSLRPDVMPGRLMALTDHINLTGANPLVGPNDDAIGPRFVGLAAVYDADLRAKLHAAALQAGVQLAEGVYLAVTGPSFETPAEIRAFRTLGADAVGMSTVLEAIAARHAGLRVAGISVITNLAEGLSPEPLSHDQTLAAARAAAGDMERVLRRFVQDA